MTKKAFIFYAAVTPAGARISLYRENLDANPGPVKSYKEFDKEKGDLLEYLNTIITECAFLPTNMADVDPAPIDNVFDVLFAAPSASLKSSIKASIHEEFDETRGLITTKLKLVSKINGERSVTVVDINPEVVEP